MVLNGKRNHREVEYLANSLSMLDQIAVVNGRHLMLENRHVNTTEDAGGLKSEIQI